MNNRLIRTALILGYGLCFQFGHWQFLLGAALMGVMLLLRDIRDAL